MRVEQFLTESASRFPDKIALIAGERRMTFAEIDRDSDGLAATLCKAGVQRGDRVALFMDNCWEAVVGIFAVLKAGAVFSPINPSTKADKLAFVLNNCQASALITIGRLLPVAREATDGAPSIKAKIIANASSRPLIDGEIKFEEAITETAAAKSSGPAGINLDLAMVIYTSGSTGNPKGVMMTHQNMVAAATSIITYVGNTAKDIIMNVLPISFDYGLYQVLMAMKAGATLVLEKSFAYPEEILKKAEQEKVTGFPLVPTMAALLLNMKDLSPGRIPSLRYITNTAAALPPAHILRLQGLFPQALLFSMYGLTECKRCTYLPPAELGRRIGSVGIPIPGTEGWVVDEDGRRVGANTIGELVIRGPHVMKGYWENEEATAKALRPGPFPWEKVLHTGDLFWMDEEGFFYFVGRKDDIIKSRGEKVSPKEIETVLYALPGVRDAAVIGVDDPILGQAARAIIASDETANLTERDVLKHCARHLEDFMVPKSVEFRSNLPKSENGKIDRRFLQLEYRESMR